MTITISRTGPLLMLVHILFDKSIVQSVQNTIVINVIAIDIDGIFTIRQIAIGDAAAATADVMLKG